MLPAEGEVTAYLLQQARSQTRRPDLQLTEVRFSPDRKLACGLATLEGEAPVVFTSSDLTPETVERAMFVPDLEPDTDLQKEVRIRDIVRNQDMCRRYGLMPPMLVTFEIDPAPVQRPAS